MADIEHDTEFHRLMHDDLVTEKLANLDLVTGTLARGSTSVRRWTVELTDEEATAWLGVLNDLRLALGVRLDITEDFDGDVDDTDPRAPALRLLSYLGWLEEQLLDALQTPTPAERRRATAGWASPGAVRVWPKAACSGGGTARRRWRGWRRRPGGGWGCRRR